MYNASTRFHATVLDASPAERVLIEFADNTIITGEDIMLSPGLKISEALTNEDELTIGSCPSSTMTVTISNNARLLDGYAYRECFVKLGVRVSSVASIYGTANPISVIRYGLGNEVIFRGNTTMPYLTINGTGTTIQPPWGVNAIIVVGTVVYCVSAKGKVWRATWADGTAWNGLANDTWGSTATKIWDNIQGNLTGDGLINVNAFMETKLAKWAAARRGLWFNSNVLYEFSDTVDCYEYVPLGTFIPVKPTKKKMALVELTAHDRMSKFDVDATPFLDGVVYPCTIGGLFVALCSYVGVPMATTTFINSTRSFTVSPALTKGVTCREVLSWIAEAACSCARMTREGEVELAWFGTESVSIPMSKYFSVEKEEYEVQKIDKLQIKGVENDIGVILGTGTNAYSVMDNPFLYGETDTEIRTYATPIYNRMIAFAKYPPINARAICDWSIQAGDIIAITIDGMNYSLPIFRQEITWNGGARVVYESAGAEFRTAVDAVNRRVWSQKRAMNEIETTVGGVLIKLTDAEGSISALEYTTKGLKLSVDAKKLIFDSSGLTVHGGGLRVQNTGGMDVLYADIDGNLTIKGTLSAVNGTFTSLHGTRVSCGGTEKAPVTVMTSDSFIIGYSDYNPAVQITTDHIRIGDLNMTPRAIDLGNSVTIDASGLWIKGAQDSVRIYMNPPTSSGGADADWVLQANGYYSLGRTTSALKYKQNIRELDGQWAIDTIKRIKPVWYEPKANPGYDDIGFIADWMAKSCPVLTVFNKGEPESVRYSRTCVLNTAAIQNILARLEKVEKEVSL
ncbi:MAG: hypothetical protein RR365_10430 [Bacteroides sp.]